MIKSKIEKILVAGASGYLGGFICRELIVRNYRVVALVRPQSNLKPGLEQAEVIEAQLTQPETLSGICAGVSIVISTVGITRQKDGLTYMDVDYQANVNLINEAKRSGVHRFIYISVLGGESLRHLKICEAKEKLVDYLKASGLSYCIVRPNGFFSDMTDFLKMAKKGRIYLFGDGHYRFNPIHGGDLAKLVVDSIHEFSRDIEIGGPDVFSQKEVAELAFKACRRPVKIVYLPDWLRRFTLWCLRRFTPVRVYGPLEFFLTTMARDLLAPEFGTRHLEQFYKEYDSQ